MTGSQIQSLAVKKPNTMYISSNSWQ